MSEPGHERRICLVCGRVLDYHEGFGYRHSVAQDVTELDHPAIPVLPKDAPEQLRERCDFCYADETSYVVPAKTFALPGISSMSVGDWAACEACAREIQKDAWTSLFRRVLASWEVRHGPMDDHTRTAMRRMHRELRKNITGPVYKGQP